MSHKISIPPKEELKNLYRDLMSISALSRHYNTSNPTVRKWLNDYDIQTNSLKDVNQSLKRTERIPSDVKEKLGDYDYLYDLYCVKKITAEQIGQMLGVSEAPVKKYVKKHGIPRQDHRKRNTFSIKLKNVLDLYTNKGKTCEEIATIYDTTKATIQRWLVENDVERRNPNEYERKFIKVSKPCEEIVERIKEYYDGEIVLNNRSVLKGKELDIYIPDKNFAIEYNGVFYHLYRPEHEDNESLMKGPRYHLSKTLGCKENDITLFHVFSDEYKNNPELIHAMVKNRLGFSQRIFARDCVVNEIDRFEKSQFYLRNHIQGDDRSTIHYGLFHTGKLVSVMSFCKARFGEYDYELNRFCSDRDLVVVGGFSKLLKRFSKEYAFKNIVSYCDRRFSVGNVYQKNGFIQRSVNPPQYYYVKNGTEDRLHRMNFTKKRLLKKLGEGVEGSEYELAKRLGYDRIYDCGTITFVYENTTDPNREILFIRTPPKKDKLKPKKHSIRMNKTRAAPDIDILKELHFDKKISKREISRHFKCRVSTVEKWFSDYGLEFISQQDLLRHKLGKPPVDKDIIYDLYKNQKITTRKIGEMFNVSDVLICIWLREYGIDANNNYNVSSAEKEILNWLNTELGENFEENNRKILNGKELDMYSESRNLAIEYNGLYYHSERNGFDKWAHRHKMDECEKVGIRLIHIFEDEWLHRKEQVKGFLKSVLHKNENVVQARKCKIEEIDNDTLQKFLDDYHVKGKTNKQELLCLGLRHDGVLVGVISFAKHHRNNDKIVLNRLCFRGGYGVIGGSEKLFKHSVERLGVDQIVSWSDNRWSMGGVYEKLGFMKSKELPIDYSYVKNSKRISKQACTKKRLGARDDQTEKERAEELGLYRIWDCGKTRWVFENA